MTAKLHAALFHNGTSLGSIITEGADQLVIGNSRSADMVLPEISTKSAIHALLRLTPENEIRLFDLGSDTGTYVKGKKIIEHFLQHGESFAIGEHEIRVRLLQEDRINLHPFWNKNPAQEATLEFSLQENGITTQEFSVAENKKLLSGKKIGQLYLQDLPLRESFLVRRHKKTEVLLPQDWEAKVYDSQNTLLRSSEEAKIEFQFGEKVQLKSKNRDAEIFLYWRASGTRISRNIPDADAKYVKKSLLIACASMALLFAMMYLIRPKPNSEPATEAIVGKTSYFRLRTDSGSAAPAKPAPAASTTKSKNISDTISKLLDKKPSITEKIKEAVSQTGKITTRSISSNTNMQAQEIHTIQGADSAKTNALQANLSAGGGKGQSGNLKGFAGGSGTSIGGSIGNIGGKGFGLNIGDEEAEAIGGLDKSLIAAVVQANLGQIKHCYEKQLIINSNLSGKIVAAWSITKDGTVSESSVKKTSMNNAAVENCIAGKIKTWIFPKPKGNGTVLVSYPFLFKSMN